MFVGWFVGKIEYFNKKLQEFKITYSDDTVHYVNRDDIDGVDVVLTL